MTGRFDIARALAARGGGGDAPLSRNSIEHRSLQDLLSQKPICSSRTKRDPDAQQYQQSKGTSRSRQKKHTNKHDKDDDDDADNPLPNLEVDQLLDLLSVVGTGVLEGHQAGSIKLKKPSPAKKIKQTRSIDAPTETEEELQAIIKRLERKKATAVTKEKIIGALLAGGPDAELPSPEQVAKLLEEATSTMFSPTEAAPVSPEDMVKKLVGGEKTRKLPQVSDTPEMKLLKDVVVRQQGELEKLRAMVKQALDHTDQMREVHTQHSSKQEQEIKRLKKLLQDLREKGAQAISQKQESLAEQLRRKFAASKNPTRSPSRRSSRYEDTRERPSPHKQSRSSFVKRAAIASPTEQPEPRHHLMEGERGPPQFTRSKTMTKENVEQEERQGEEMHFDTEAVPDLSQSREVVLTPSAVPSGASHVIDLCGNDDNDGATDAEEESDPEAIEDSNLKKDVEMEEEPSSEMDSDAADLEEEPRQGTGLGMAEMDVESSKIQEPSDGIYPTKAEEPMHGQGSIEALKVANEESSMGPNQAPEMRIEESLNEEDAFIFEAKVPVFIRQLHKALEHLETEGQDDIASFVDAGKAFNIHKPDKFAEHVMPRFFPTIPYQSFHRQLNSYEFQCMTGGVDAGAYFHDHFIKGDFAKAAMIKRNVRKSLLSQTVKERRSVDSVVETKKGSQLSPEDIMPKSGSLHSPSVLYGEEEVKASQVLLEDDLADSKSLLPPPKREEENNEKVSEKDEVELAEAAESAVWV